MLAIDNLSVRFGGLAAVDDVSTTIERGRITAIIGPNGAGKTTLFNLISGTVKPSCGSIHLHGRDVTGLRADHMASLGVARTFQTTQLFDHATVFDNLIIGHRLRCHAGLWDALLGTPRLRLDEAACRTKAQEVLECVGLQDIAHRLASDITQEQRKRIAIALALATEPSLLLLDEPAGGINPEETQRLAALIRKLADDGLTVCLVEHKMDMVMGLADTIVVLNHGKKIAEGSPAAIRKNEHVIHAYLGVPDAQA
ncbi:MAG TPA: ABC transporter ATP-binding protein [Thiomonas arsenitoxydans]|jgi:ABC-type branched-subunit amino acid transport system ATPase component|uniref:ABC transporter related protein n=1 Tax=Thiomonas intermedia (strain K12) TaxID=75379 RepID=D5X1E5_THIK1|nr:ABC transporter ATP-binding protein [Acidocella sp.]OZB77060.1 MAG: ABC transporter ATP-binding protein [Thiomonas sp. 14-64-326]HOI67377.1 ABC transporter ATP-binding protein [Thiomonas arsenitoxydans]